MHTDNTENNSFATVPAVVLVCILVPLALITAIIIMVVICLLFKKGKKKKQSPEHTYDSVSLPPSALPSLPNPNLDYDEVKTMNCSDDQFELTKNAAYSSFKLPSAADHEETTPHTDYLQLIN